MKRWSLREVPHNSIPELILNNIFSNDLDIHKGHIGKGLMKCTSDIKMESTFSEDQVIRRTKERKKKRGVFLVRDD